MLSDAELSILTAFYFLSLGVILPLTYSSFKRDRFSFHLLFTLTYLLVFYLGFPFSLALSFGFDISLNSFDILLKTLLVSTVFYVIYYTTYKIRLLPVKKTPTIMASHAEFNSVIEAKITAFLLLIVSLVAMFYFLSVNGLLLFKLDGYNQIFSAQVNAVALKRFFYFFIPALLILYFLYPNKKIWWGFLFIGVMLGALSYLSIGGTRSNLALVIALFVFIGIAQGYVSIPTLLAVGIAGIGVMFVLAMRRYGLSLSDNKALYYFLQLTRDTFSPWEHLSQILAYKNVAYQNLTPIIRDFYVYIPKSIWFDRPDLILNTANYFTWEIRHYYAGLALSPTLIGSFYIMGGIPFVLMGAVFTGLIMKGFDSLYFYAKQSFFRNKQAVFQAYCFANIFTIVVLAREGLDAFVSRFVFFNIIFFMCYFAAKLMASVLARAGLVSITTKGKEND